MSVDRRIVELAETYARLHPVDAARTLETLPGDQVIAFLEAAPLEIATTTLASMPIAAASHYLERLPPVTAALLLAQKRTEEAADLLRSVTPEACEGMLSVMPNALAEQLRGLMGYPTGTVGTIMRRLPPCISQDASFAEALVDLRRQRLGGIPYVYVVSRSDALVGVVRLADLLSGGSEDRVSEALRPVDTRLLVTMSIAAAQEHPGWLLFTTLPVVDENGLLVGGLEYRTLLNRLRVSPRAGAHSAGEALGELYHLGMVGMLQIASTGVGRTDERASREENQ